MKLSNRPPKPFSEVIVSPKYKTMKDVQDRISELFPKRESVPFVPLPPLSVEEEAKREAEMKAAWEARRIEEEDFQKRQVSTWLMGEGSRMAGIRLLDPNNWKTQAVEYLRAELAAGLKQSYLLLGGNGCGKTFAAVALMAEIAKKHRCQFIHAYKLSQLIYRREFKELDRLEMVPCLVIDDFGAEPEGFKGSDFTAHIDYLFDYRYQNGLFTILTSNLGRDGLKTCSGRLLSRLREVGKVAEFTDSDYRKEKTNEIH